VADPKKFVNPPKVESTPTAKTGTPSRRKRAAPEDNEGKPARRSLLSRISVAPDMHIPALEARMTSPIGGRTSVVDLLRASDDPMDHWSADMWETELAQFPGHESTRLLLTHSADRPAKKAKNSDGNEGLHFSAAYLAKKPVRAWVFRWADVIDFSFPVRVVQGQGRQMLPHDEGIVLEQGWSSDVGVCSLSPTSSRLWHVRVPAQGERGSGGGRSTRESWFDRPG
jgi:hypothetical protein